MEEEKNGNKLVIKKSKIPNRTFKKSKTLLNRHISINHYKGKIKYETILPKQRIIKSREKEVKKEGNVFPIIKNNSFNKKIIKNNSPNPNMKMIKKNTPNLILPNFDSKKQINKINNAFKDTTNNNNNKINEKISLNDEENKNNEIIIKYMEEFINVINSLTNKNLFVSLLNTFYKKHLLNYELNTSLKKITDDNCINCIKHIFILITCFIFLSKDESSYKFNNQRLKELSEQFIFVALKNLKLKSSQKFKTLINRIKPNKKTFTQIINSIIKLLYNNKNEYSVLKGALNQIITNIQKYSLSELTKIINNSLLYNYNHITTKINSINKIKKVSKSKEKQNQIEELIPSEPYIKTKMTKKFCMVLDIDETITHTLKLPMGDYFLVRPGVKDFLQEMNKYFEIIIFTSSPKNYADNILDKIDLNGEFIKYRLYRRHAIYENGDCVKKLSMIGRDLKKVVFVDNLKSNAKYNPDNLYHIKSWYSDIEDNELIKLKDKLKEIATCGVYDDDITKGLIGL